MFTWEPFSRGLPGAEEQSFASGRVLSWVQWRRSPFVDALRIDVPSSRANRRGRVGANVIRRRRALAVMVVLCVSVILGWLIYRDTEAPALKPAGATPGLASAARKSSGQRVTRARRPARVTAGAVRRPPVPSAPAQPPAVGVRVIRVVQPGRAIQVNGTTEPRTLITIVRYPATGPLGAVDLRDAPFARPAARLPLIVFGHGFAVTPAPYSRLLVAWARAGYVVAAPVFPLENANAPGGPQESDLVNQPHDMSAVISTLLAAASAGRSVFAGMIDPQRIALNPDCGFAPGAGEPPSIDEAYVKLCRLTEAALRVRSRLTLG